MFGGSPEHTRSASFVHFCRLLRFQSKQVQDLTNLLAFWATSRNAKGRHLFCVFVFVAPSSNQAKDPKSLLAVWTASRNPKGLLRFENEQAKALQSTFAFWAASRGRKGEHIDYVFLFLLHLRNRQAEDSFVHVNN